MTPRIWAALSAAAITAVAAALLAPGDSAKASHCAMDTYDHNGSMMEVIACDEGLNIAYDSPKRSLRKHGVSSGTMLFEGSVAHSGLISGQARVFKRGCGAATYPVSGRWVGNDRIVLTGQAPVRGLDCSIKRYRPDRMEFGLIRG